MGDSIGEASRVPESNRGEGTDLVSEGTKRGGGLSNLSELMILGFRSVFLEIRRWSSDHRFFSVNFEIIIPRLFLVIIEIISLSSRLTVLTVVVVVGFFTLVAVTGGLFSWLSRVFEFSLVSLFSDFPRFSDFPWFPYFSRFSDFPRFSRFSDFSRFSNFTWFSDFSRFSVFAWFPHISIVS